MRLPNPWVTLPVLLSTVAGGVVGYLITEASCVGRCTVPAILVGTGVAVAVAVGVGTVVVLAVRSMREWRELQDREVAVFEESAAGAEPEPPTC
jgi:hypothetical protein